MNHATTVRVTSGRGRQAGFQTHQAGFQTRWMAMRDHFKWMAIRDRVIPALVAVIARRSVLEQGRGTRPGTTGGLAKPRGSLIANTGPDDGARFGIASASRSFVWTARRYGRTIRPHLALICAVLMLVMTPTFAQSSGERVALIIGNSAYDHVPKLPNAGSDANLVAATLKQLGFRLIGGGPRGNVDKTQFDKLIHEFGDAVQGADVAMFYYAGHGMQVDGVNWLVPTDANPTKPRDLEFQMVNAELVLKQMDGAGTSLNIVILDACRNNPFADLGTRAVQGGLAQMRAPEGTLISFATQPGNVAQDGTGPNGPFALALTDAMKQPSMDIFRVFNRVGLSVKRETGGVQLPWVSSSPIDGDFYFVRNDESPTGAEAGTARPAPPRDPPVALASNRGGAPAALPPLLRSDQPENQTADGLAALKGKAENGNAAAQHDLGYALTKGLGTPRDDAQAREWFSRAAAQGLPKAQYWMGVMTELGRGGARSYADALGWYQKSADQGYSPAEAAVGRFYGRGLGVDADFDKRTMWMRRAADHGEASAQWALGNFFQFGDHMPKDIQAARQWFLRAAEQGHIPSEIRLGMMATNGNGTPVDYTEARRWFEKASNAGDAWGTNYLGTMYRRGQGGPPDFQEAKRLYQIAIDKGNARAEFNMGLLYADGLGVPKDMGQAREWFTKAAAAGNQLAIDRLAKLDAEVKQAPQAPPPPLAPPGRPAPAARPVAAASAHHMHHRPLPGQH